jgi:H+-transporting ATPase
LWGAVLGTQALATCIAIFGFGLVTPIAWYWAALVWGYAIAWFLFNDRAKLLTYWLLDHFGASKDSTAVDKKPEPQSAPQAAAAPDAKSNKDNAKAPPTPAQPAPPAKP